MSLTTSTSDAGFFAMLKEQDQKDRNGGQNGEFKVAPAVPIGDKALVRLVGKFKCFNIGWVKDDNNKPMLLTMPAYVNKHSEEPSIISDFIDKVLTRVFVEYTPEEMAANVGTPKEGKKGQYRYIYENRNDYGTQETGTMTLSQIFWNVFKSGTTAASNPYYESQKSWRGTTVYIQNAIDRLNYQWHKDNKSTALLMRNVKVTAKGNQNKEVSLFSVGTGLTALQDTYDGFDYDILIAPGSKPTEPFTVKNASKPKQVDFLDEISRFLTKEEIEKISTNPGFTDEESTWNEINISEYYKITSAKSILSRLGKTIKAFDDMVGTDFYARLSQEAGTPVTSSAPTTSAPAQATAPAVDMGSAPVQVAAAPTESANADISAFYAQLD